MTAAAINGNFGTMQWPDPASGTLDVLTRLLIAVGIGLLIGLEREYSKRVVEQQQRLFAGIRTYTLITLFGFLSALVADHFGPWLLVVAFLGLLAMLIVAYRLTARGGDIGGTSEMSGILAFLLGVMVFEGMVLLAVVITVIVAGLLSLKLPLHRFVASLTMEEIRAVIQFVVISSVVLPFLPSAPFGPYGVWNLKDIWTMVVLVSGISLVGFLLSKVLGDRKGTLVSGIVGGLVSSTAVAVDMARRSREGSLHVLTAAVTIIAASTIMFPRVLLEAWLVNAALAGSMVLPIAVATVLGLVSAFLLHRIPDGRPVPLQTVGNPLNFGLALQFALVYMGVRWLVAFAMDRHGSAGTYAAAVLSGATDMDAITLSMARAARNGDLLTARNALLLAAASNTLFKLGITLVIGHKRLASRVAIGFGAALAGGLIAAWIGG
ncbi:MAG: MgtC/SapB family protein [Flavobacteriales bacterium]|nr:MgtC/SapB family protein [Flavobacteriales bacterium]